MIQVSKYPNYHELIPFKKYNTLHENGKISPVKSFWSQEELGHNMLKIIDNNGLNVNILYDAITTQVCGNDCESVTISFTNHDRSYESGIVIKKKDVILKGIQSYLQEIFNRKCEYLANLSPNEYSLILNNYIDVSSFELYFPNNQNSSDQIIHSHSNFN